MKYETTYPTVTAVILAAGRSVRFGTENKLLANIDGQSIVSRAMRNVLDSDVDKIVVITGHEHEAVEQACQVADAYSTPIQFERNALYATGMAGSLKTGIAHIINAQISEQNHCALICLADMPMVLPSTINSLISTMKLSQTLNDRVAEGNLPAAFVPTYNGVRGNPVLLMSALFDSILDLDGDTGARQLLAENSDVVKLVAVSDPGIVTDTDTREDLAAHQALIQR